jgi:hypothetical protein
VTLALGGREWLNLHAEAKSSKSARRKQVNSHPASSFREYDHHGKEAKTTPSITHHSPLHGLTFPQITSRLPFQRQRKRNKNAKQPLESINLYLTDVWNVFCAYLYTCMADGNWRAHFAVMIVQENFWVTNASPPGRLSNASTHDDASGAKTWAGFCARVCT